MVIITIPTTLIQIICKVILNYKVVKMLVSKGIINHDTVKRNSISILVEGNENMQWLSAEIKWICFEHISTTSWSYTWSNTYGDTVQTFNSCSSRPDVCRCLVVQTPLVNTSKKGQSHQWPTHLTNAMFSCEARDLWSHPCSGNWVAIGRAVVYYSRAVHAFSAGIKCRHSILLTKQTF